MADGPGGDVKFRVLVEGADQARNTLRAVRDEAAKASGPPGAGGGGGGAAGAGGGQYGPFGFWQQASGLAAEHSKKQVAYLQSIRDSIAQTRNQGVSLFKSLGDQMSDTFSTGTKMGGAFGFMLDTVRSGLDLLKNPWTATITLLGSAGLALEQVAQKGLMTYEAMRQLQAVSGETADRAEDIANAFKLAGVESNDVGLAMFRMGNEIETGGKSLERLGISIRDSGGELKTEGALLLEVRDRLSAMGDQGARSAALVDLFGRAGRQLAPAFALPREEFEKLMGVAEKYTAATAGFMEGAKRYARAQEETQQAAEQLNARIAETIAFPVGEVFEYWKRKAVEFTAGLLGLTKEAGADYGSKREGWIRILFGFTEAEFNEFNARRNKQLMDQAEKVRKLRQDAADKAAGRLTDPEAARLAAQVDREAQANSRRLAMDSEFESQRLKLAEGAEGRAIEVKRDALDEEIRLERERFEKVMAIRRRTTGGGDPEENKKLEAESLSRIAAFEDQKRRLELERRTAVAAESKRLLDDQVRDRQAFTDRTVALIQLEVSQQKAALEVLQVDRSTATVKTFEAETEASRRSTYAKVSGINEEIDGIRKWADENKGVFAVQQEAQQRLRDATKRRQDAELEGDKSVMESRRGLIQQLGELSKAEAGVGATLEEKAAARLEARGKKRVTAADIAAETERMTYEARETAGAFAGGGRVSLKALRESRGLTPLLGQLGDIGTVGGPGAALGQFWAQTMMQTSGQRGLLLPTAARGQAPEIAAIMQYFRTIAPGVGAPGAAPGPAPFDKTGQAVEGLSKQVKDLDGKIAQSMADVGKSLENMFDSFTDKLVRKLEFEAARS